MANPVIEAYGWTAVPRSIEALISLSQATGEAKPISVASISIPDSPLAKSVFEYAKKELAVEPFNHSMRVYCYGQAILSHAFPTWSSPSFNETYFLASLLHDIGTTSKNISSTFLSFEFQGGLISLDLLKSLSAPIEQAENVAETIIRHQDLGETGTMTRIGGLILLATLFDNAGGNPQLVHRSTIESVVEAYPRMKWTGCFAKVIRQEIALKPWAHTTHIKDFAEIVEANKLMEPYDG